jgi:hypothetical protein
MIDMLKVVVVVVLIISLAGCVGNISFEGQKPEISDKIPQGNYQLVSSGSIEKTISREDLDTKENAYIKSKFKIYNISSVSSTKLSINSIDKGSKLESNQNISKTSKEELYSQVNTTKLAEKDSALTEESIQNLLENNISVEEIVENSDVKVESVISKNKSLDESDSSVSNTQIKKGLIYVIISRPIIKTPGELVDVGSTKPSYILSKVDITDNISVGEKVKSANRESGNAEVEIYEGTIGNSSNSEIAVSVDKEDNNQFISLAYYNPRIESRENVISLIEDTDVANG